MIERIGRDRRQAVQADGKGAIGHAGAALLRQCADRTGLTEALARCCRAAREAAGGTVPRWSFS
ncbi:hypothetical protein [Actinacidiphila soli]|uniref:hypothetical protein n=1 Tax=Actinacidiphila soli TaxID=2487275 RepID=UPI000FCC64BB|nr:hypothetical protein [Actinacidiphila soli]